MHELIRPLWPQKVSQKQARLESIPGGPQDFQSARLRSTLARQDVRTDRVVWGGIPELASSDLASNGPRYGQWTRRLEAQAGLPTEFLLPRIPVRYEDVLPRSMRAMDERFDPSAVDEILRHQWGYYFYLGNGMSTMDNTPSVLDRNRASSILRQRMINDVVAGLFPDDLHQQTLLDFACNWGGIAIDMALHGLKDVSAFDLKPENIEKAKLLASYAGAQVNFQVADVYDLPAEYDDGFDIVYNLGLLYHVTDPVRLAQLTFALTRKVAVFDTICHKEPMSGYVQAYISDSAIKRSGMGSQQIELHPTYRGLIDLIRFAGFKDLIEVEPEIGPEFPERERDHYFTGHRRTIIALKE